MQVNEISRLTQLTPAGMAKMVAVMCETGMLFSAIENELSAKITELSNEQYASALAWYPQANAFAAYLVQEYGTTLEIASAVISAVSPRMAWRRNKSVAEFVFQNLESVSELSPIDAAKAFGKGLYGNFAMAVKIARGDDISETLTGTKRRSFYNNIVAPEQGDSVTIDTWMARALMATLDVSLPDAIKLLTRNKVALGGTGAGYYVLAESCRTLAKSFCVHPCQIQAAYWVAVSGSADGGATYMA